MQKYKKVAINIAFLTIILSSGAADNSFSALNPDSDLDLNIKKMPKYSQEKHEKILNSFENSDYQAWQKLVGRNNKLSNIIDEFSFRRFAAARMAARNGQYDKAIKITEELKKGVENKLS